MSGLLLDQMLPLRLCVSLKDILGDITHVKQVSLSKSDDADVFANARQHDLSIVTKDSDFQSLLAIHGSPPRVNWIRIGNASVDNVENLLRDSASDIVEFHNTEAACLILR